MDAVTAQPARNLHRTRPPPGATRGVLEAAAGAVRCGDAATLALVLATEGSTYVEAGAVALFDSDGATTGWLSGGCLERVVADRAREVARGDAVEWLELDTRDDEALFSGAATGCRGVLRIALLPTRALGGLDALVPRWLVSGTPLAWRVGVDGSIEASCGDLARIWQVAAARASWTDPRGEWHTAQAAPLRVLACGTGPEAVTLLPLLRTLGMFVGAVEQRPRFLGPGRGADVQHELAPRAAVEALAARHDAALVMHHAFERDLEALDALARTQVRYVGLLGPKRRRDELLALLAPAARESLAPRLHAPIGHDLGGRGPEAIALGIAAELQQLAHRRA